MLDIPRVLNNDRLMRAMTGLNRKAFEALVPSFAQVYAASVQRQNRKRAAGAGRKGNLVDVPSKLFFVLFYFKCYPTFDLAGILFDFDRSQACRWVHRLQPLLEAALDRELVLPARKITSIAEFIERFPNVERVMIDGTERPIQRPQESQRQKKTYSGKKKRHTRKQLGAVDQGKRIMVLTPMMNGRLHDKCILDATPLVEFIPQEIPIQTDLEFEGLQHEYGNIQVPHKKPRGGNLSETQKLENRELSRERVVCENAFSGMKRYKAATDIYRNRKQDFDDHLMLTSAGLWNFYLQAA